MLITSTKSKKCDIIPRTSVVLTFMLFVLIVALLLLISSKQLPAPAPAPVPRVMMVQCFLSFFESDGFICEPDDLWKQRKEVYQTQDKENMKKRPDGNFFVSNWEPNFHCSHAERIGEMGDGGKWICDPFRLRSRSSCLVYSVGSNGEFSFERAMKTAVPNCEIHTFDQNLYQCPNDSCIFHQITFGNGTHPHNSKTWSAIVQELNHKNRHIDVLKIDIEGGEYFFFPAIMGSDSKELPKQILVELHPKEPNTIHAFFELFRQRNYVIFNKEPNLIAGPQYIEYTFLKLHPDFFLISQGNSTNS